MESHKLMGTLWAHTGAIGCIVIMHVLLMLDEEHGHVSYSVLFQCAVLLLEYLPPQTVSMKESGSRR